MTDKKIKKMLSDIIDYVDYDIWKAYFKPSEDEHEDASDADLKQLIEIVKKHLK